MFRKLKKIIGGKKKPLPIIADNHKIRDAIVGDPLNAGLHFQLALESARRNTPQLAYAELKTAQFLGFDRGEIERVMPAFSAALPDLQAMNHNQWYRLHSLANVLKQKAAGNKKLAILDVGGGMGWLAAFIPEMDYCLVEPTENGISGIDMPFAAQSFDYVVSCHVLEHIPVPDREAFLDQLLAKARKGVVLLNPFHQEGTHVEDRLKLFIDIADADWAREHLDCSLPKVVDIEDYATRHNLHFTATANGSLLTTIALVFMDYFAEKAGKLDDWKKINQFINEKYVDLMDSQVTPTAYMICLDRNPVLQEGK